MLSQVSLFIVIIFGTFANLNIYQPPKNLKPPEYFSSCIEIHRYCGEQNKEKLYIFGTFNLYSAPATIFQSLKVVFFLNRKHETLHCIHILAASAFLYVCISMVYTEFLYFIITCYVSIHVFFYVNFGISHKNTLNGNRMMCIIS